MERRGLLLGFKGVQKWGLLGGKGGFIGLAGNQHHKIMEAQATAICNKISYCRWKNVGVSNQGRGGAKRQGRGESMLLKRK